MASFAVNVIRAAFAAGEHIAPTLSGRAAFEIFCRTPNPKKLNGGERRAIEAAQAMMADARRHCLNLAAGQQLTAYEFRPERSERRYEPGGNTVLVIHGWRSRTEYMRSLIAGFLDAGFRVISVDLPGHGATGGRRLNLTLGVAAARTAADWFGPFVAMVGHSFGGAVAINAAAGSIRGIAPVQTAGIVTIASPSSIPRLFEHFGKVIGVGPAAQDALSARVKAIAGRSLAEFESRDILKGLPVPTLVVHDEQDREVGVSEARDMAAAGGHVTLKITDGLGHRRIISNSVVVDSVVEFVAGQSSLNLH